MNDRIALLVSLIQRDAQGTHRFGQVTGHQRTALAGRQIQGRLKITQSRQFKNQKSTLNLNLEIYYYYTSRLLFIAQNTFAGCG